MTRGAFSHQMDGDDDPVGGVEEMRHLLLTVAAVPEDRFVCLFQRCREPLLKGRRLKLHPTVNVQTEWRRIAGEPARGLQRDENPFVR